MLMQILYPYIRFALGTLYPAYKTWKALKRKDETIRRRWMKYWVSFGAFQMFELVADITLAFILPFYIELKLAFLVWLVLGTKLIFDSIVNRELTKREKAIDRWLNKIGKARNELVAMVWYEISRCSIKIAATIMSGGLAVLIKSPDQSNEVSPTCSDEEVEEVVQEDTIHDDEPDINENHRTMEWDEIAFKEHSVNCDSRLESTKSAENIMVVRKSARRVIKSNSHN